MNEPNIVEPEEPQEPTLTITEDSEDVLRDMIGQDDGAAEAALGVLEKMVEISTGLTCSETLTERTEILRVVKEVLKNRGLIDQSASAVTPHVRSGDELRAIRDAGGCVACKHGPYEGGAPLWICKGCDEFCNWERNEE